MVPPLLSGFWTSLATRGWGGLGGLRPPPPQGRTDGEFGAGEARKKINNDNNNDDNTDIQLYGTIYIYIYIYIYVVFSFWGAGGTLITGGVIDCM